MQDIAASVELYFSFFVYSLSSWDCKTRYSLPELCEPLCELVESFPGPADSIYSAIEKIILRVLETHRMLFVLREKKGCRNEVVHSSLLALARLAFRSRFPDSLLVSRLLGEIYRCDKDLRKIMMGAYHEPDKCFGFLLYKSREEGMQALRYFLHHTNAAKKVFFSEGVPRRLADLSLQVPNFYHPAVYSISTNRYDTFLLLVEYGSDLCDSTEPTFNYSVEQRISAGLGLHSQVKKEFRRLFFEANPELEFRMPSLLELSKKAIRRQLWEEFQLPHGIRSLPLPPLLKRYVDIDPG